MGAATFIIELKHGQNADGTRSVRVRITKDRLKAYVNTGLKLLHADNARKSEWNAAADYRKDNWVTPRHPRHTRLNLELRYILDGLETVARANPTLSAKQIKQQYEGTTAEQEQPALGFFAYLEERVALKKRVGQFSNGVNLSQAVKALKAFAGEKPDKQILKEDFLMDFVAHLSKTLAPNTVKVYTGSLATAYAKGVLQGVLPNAGDPFGNIRLPGSRQKQPRPAPTDLLATYALTPANAEERYARDTVLLLFLLYGARVSEGLRLEWSDVTDDHVSYWPAKGGARKKHVPRSPMLNRILESFPKKGRFVLPYLRDWDVSLNQEGMVRVLKKITGHLNHFLRTFSERHGIPRLTTHMVRRAFTDASVSKLSNIRQAQELLGHSSVQTTEHYASEQAEGAMREASMKVYGGLRLGEQEGNTEQKHQPPPVGKRAAKRRRNA